MKKVIAILLCLAAINITVYADDIEAEKAYYPILDILGISDGTEDFQQPVTREEFAAYVYKLGGEHVKKYDSTNIRFSDIKASEYIEIINALAQAGIMSGYSDNTFRPDNIISSREAVCVILRLMGYEKIAEASGGYPNGYVRIASETELSDGVKFETELTYANMYRLLFNALTAPIAGVSYEDDKFVMGEAKDNYLLHQVFEIQYLTGQAVANENAYIGDREATAEGYVQLLINGEENEYYQNNVNVKDILGYTAKFYINAEDEIIAYDIDAKKLTDITLLGRDITEVTDGIFTIEAEEDKSKAKKYKISPNADFIYNGKNYFGVTKEDIISTDSKVRLIDTDGDNKYDIVYIWEFENYFVDGVYASSGIIKDKNDKYIELKSDSADYKTEFYKMGKITDFSSIQEWDVLSVAKSKDVTEPLYTVFISSDVIEGTVTSIGTNSITIDNVEYTTAKSFDDNLIKSGTAAYFGKNCMDEICCYYKKLSGEKQYGYLTRAAKDDSEETINIVLINSDAKKQRFVTAEKFYVNNEKSTIDTFLDEVSPNGDTINQLIAYKLNDAGEIKRIYLANEIEEPNPKNTSTERLVYNKKISGVKIQYTLHSEYIIGPDTKIFQIVTDRNGNVVEQKCRMVTSLPVNAVYPLKIYDAYEDLIPGAIIYPIDESEASNEPSEFISRYAFVVSEVIKECPEDEVIYRVKGCIEGITRDFVLDDTFDPSTWKKGDIYMIASYDGETISGYVKLFAFTKPSGTNEKNVIYADSVFDDSNVGYNYDVSDITSIRSTIYGTIDRMNETGTYINPANGGTKRVFTAYSQKVYIYNKKTGYRVADKGEVIPGSKCFIHSRYGQGLDVVVFED